MHEPLPPGTRVAIDTYVEDSEDWTGCLLWVVSELQAHGIPPTFVGLHLDFPSPKDFYSQIRAYPPARANARRMLLEMTQLDGFVGHTARRALESVPEENRTVDWGWDESQG
jgi:hypothetical protein